MDLDRLGDELGDRRPGPAQLVIVVLGRRGRVGADACRDTGRSQRPGVCDVRPCPGSRRSPDRPAGTAAGRDTRGCGGTGCGSAGPRGRARRRRCGTGRRPRRSPAATASGSDARASRRAAARRSACRRGRMSMCHAETPRRGRRRPAAPVRPTTARPSAPIAAAGLRRCVLGKTEALERFEILGRNAIAKPIAVTTSEHTITGSQSGEITHSQGQSRRPASFSPTKMRSETPKDRQRSRINIPPNVWTTISTIFITSGIKRHDRRDEHHHVEPGISHGIFVLVSLSLTSLSNSIVP